MRRSSRPKKSPQEPSNLVCSACSLYAPPAYCMRQKKGYVELHPKPHTICRSSINPRMRFAFYIKKSCVHILYAGLHTVCGTRILYVGLHTGCGL